jgi:hypothetical protein
MRINVSCQTAGCRAGIRGGRHCRVESDEPLVDGEDVDGSLDTDEIQVKSAVFCWDVSVGVGM